MTLLPDGTTLVAGGIKEYSGALYDAEIYTPGFAEATSVSGQGAITTATGTATFNMDLNLPDGHHRPTGYFHFTDATADVIISKARFRRLTFSGNTARISGRARLENGGGNATFSVIAIDNSTDGSSDTFSITLSNGYSASGVLVSGNIVLE